MKLFEVEMRERAETEYEEYDNRESYKLGAMHALESELVRAMRDALEFYRERWSKFLQHNPGAEETLDGWGDENVKRELAGYRAAKAYDEALVKRGEG